MLVKVIWCQYSGSAWCQTGGSWVDSPGRSLGITIGNAAEMLLGTGLRWQDRGSSSIRTCRALRSSTLLNHNKHHDVLSKASRTPHASARDINRDVPWSSPEPEPEFDEVSDLTGLHLLPMQSRLHHLLDGSHVRCSHNHQVQPRTPVSDRL